MTRLPRLGGTFPAAKSPLAGSGVGGFGSLVHPLTYEKREKCRYTLSRSRHMITQGNSRS